MKQAVLWLILLVCMANIYGQADSRDTMAARWLVKRLDEKLRLPEPTREKLIYLLTEHRARIREIRTRYPSIFDAYADKLKADKIFLARLKEQFGNRVYRHYNRVVKRLRTEGFSPRPLRSLRSLREKKDPEKIPGINYIVNPSNYSIIAALQELSA